MRTTKPTPYSSLHTFLILCSVATAMMAVAQAPETYTIQSGDSLSVLAKKFNCTVDQLAQWNNIEDPDRIRAGKTLTLFPSESATAPAVVTAVAPEPETQKIVTTAPETKEAPSTTGTVRMGEFEGAVFSANVTIEPAVEAGLPPGTKRITLPPMDLSQETSENINVLRWQINTPLRARDTQRATLLLWAPETVDCQSNLHVTLATDNYPDLPTPTETATYAVTTLGTTPQKITLELMLKKNHPGTYLQIQWLGEHSLTLYALPKLDE